MKIGLTTFGCDGGLSGIGRYAAVYESGRWRYERAPRPTHAWTVPIEWNPAWGKWRGLGRYDLEIAWRFDRILQQAESIGVRLPLAG